MSEQSLAVYPSTPAERDRWILERRGDRNKVESTKPYAYLVEQERFATGEIGCVATIFLTNRECPWRCAMCDLWRNTLTESVAPGEIPSQIAYALERLPDALQIKLYNSGSFFDPRAIPYEDYGVIAELVSHFERVIVECHPALVGERCLGFLDKLRERAPLIQLEVAMGLETVQEQVLEKLNKRMTVEQYADAAEKLRSNGIDLRSFVLVQPPFMQPEESLHWACRSIDYAFECGATAVSLLPTRGGNGAMEELATAGEFIHPKLEVVEAAHEYGIKLSKGRVFVDLWDIESVKGCPICRTDRIARIRYANLAQQTFDSISCDTCRGTE